MTHHATRMHRLIAAQLAVIGLASATVNALVIENLPARANWSGTYATAVTLVRETNSCADATVQDNVTTVRHSDDSNHLTLTHVGVTYDGSVTEDGQFRTEPTTIKSSDVSYVITITGQFKTNGFSATVTVEEQRTPRARSCSYQVKWVGTKRPVRLAQGAGTIVAHVVLRMRSVSWGTLAVEEGLT
jgi:hypothetical protein